MDDHIDHILPSEDLQKFERIYVQELQNGQVSAKTKFEYAWCLVRSKYPPDIRKGIILLQELFNTHPEGKRDYLFYLAVGNTRIKEYNKALNYVKLFLEIEPTNEQVISLERQIKKKMEKEGLIGMAVVGGGVVALAGLVGLGLALTKGK